MGNFQTYQNTETPDTNVEENKFFDNNFLNMSAMSDPAAAYLIPGVKNVKAKFIYNFFVRDEREFSLNNDNSNHIFESNYEDNFDIDYLTKQSELSPRSVMLTYRLKSMLNSQILLTDQEKTLLESFDINNISKGDTFNPKALMFNLNLTDKDSTKKVLSQLKYSAIIIENKPIGDQSYQDVAKSVSDLLQNPGGVSGIGKKILIEKINASRSQGFSIAANENTEVLSTDPIGNIIFSNNINKLFLNNTLTYSNLFNAGIFETELLSFKKHVVDMKASALNVMENSGGPDAINDMVHGIYAVPLQMLPLPDNLSEEQLRNVVLRKNAGYLIEKLEQFPDGTTIARNSVYITNTNQTQYLDKDVRYGGKYIYKIRSVMLFQTPTVLLNENPALDQAVLAKFLVASDEVDAKVICTEKIPPKAPSAINARMDFKLKKPILRWQFPINKQRDIKRFQVFKRLNESSPFVLIAEYNFDNSLTPTGVKEVAQSKNLYNLNPKLPKLSHMDMTFNINQKPIYAIASVDAHGLSSNLSTQVQVEYLRYENRLKVSLFSRSGAPKQYPNLYMNSDTFLDNIKTSGHDKMILYFDPEYYRVFKNEISPEQAALLKPDHPIPEKDLAHIAVNPKKDTYKIHIINLDLQKDQTIDIRLEDTSTGDLRLGGSTFNALRHNNFLN